MFRFYQELPLKIKIITLYVIFDFHYSLFLLTRAIKYNLRAGAAKYKLGPGSSNTNWGRGPGNTNTPLAQAFSCEFCKIFKNTFLTEYLCTTASETFQQTFNNLFTIKLIQMIVIVSSIAQTCIQDPVKRLRWSVLRKQLTPKSR